MAAVISVVRSCSIGLGLWLLTGCTNLALAPDQTEDGLVRAPSSRSGAVYRAPGASFVHYRKILLEPLSVSFERDWQRQHPEVSDKEIERIRAQAAALFRIEFARELVERGTYTFTDTAGPDVLKVTPSIVDLEINAPRAGQVGGVRTYVVKAGEMTLIAELHDAASGALIGRVIDHQRAREDPFHVLQIANQVTNADEASLAFQHWSRLLREALDVAKVERVLRPEGHD